jgi:lysyl-tRNA synthetase class 2
MEKDELYKQRLRKLQRLRETGAEVYQRPFRNKQHINETVAHFIEGKPARLAGRLVSVRGHGKSVFADLRDASGKIQLYFRKDALGEEAFTQVKQLEVGDIIGVEGNLFKTKMGEKTLEVKLVAILVKALREPPLGKSKDEKQWYSLADVETRYRQRYLDLLAHEDSRLVFFLRSRILNGIRTFLNSKGFREVETPMMQPLPGGATARPFITRHRALKAELYLRVAPELYLKRLLVGGMEKIYELNRTFRNEGISTRHNPEFTMLELYQAYADYNDIMDITEEMICSVAREVVQADTLSYCGHEISLNRPWSRIPLLKAIMDIAGADLSPERGEKAALSIAERLALQLEGPKTYAKIVDETVKTFVVPKLVQPTFLVDYPVDLSPLAKRKPDEPLLTERFQLFIGGLEVGNAFSELCDPIEQRERFENQLVARKYGDDEAHRMDKDFIHALEFGMPPAGGLGIGVDRLVMLLADRPSIRDVILFPQLRPQDREERR